MTLYCAHNLPKPPEPLRLSKVFGRENQRLTVIGALNSHFDIRIIDCPDHVITLIDIQHHQFFNEYTLPGHH